MTKSNQQSLDAWGSLFCITCQRPTRIKAVPAIDFGLYVRCEKCGYVWSIPERRAPRTWKSDPFPNMYDQASPDQHRTQDQQQHDDEDAVHGQYRAGRC